MGSIFVGSILSLFMGLIGFLLTLAASVGAVVVNIFKLIYLYQTAKLFKNHPSEN